MEDLKLESIYLYLEKVLEYFDQNCTNIEHLYDARGNDFKITRLIRHIRERQNIAIFTNDLASYSPHDLAWAILEIFNLLVDPLFTEKFYQFFFVFSFHDEAERIEKFKQFLPQLPSENLTIMNLLFKIFVKISVENAFVTCLSPTYISDLFSISLVRFKWQNQIEEIGNIYYAPIIITTFINYYSQLFTDIDSEYQLKQRISQEKANEFMQYAIDKYTSFENHLKKLYNDILSKKKVDASNKKLIVETIKIELNDNPFHRKKERKQIIGFFEPQAPQVKI